MTETALAADNELKPYIAELDQHFDAARRDIGAPGLIYGVIADGKVKHIKSFGVRNIETGAPITKSSAFRIASMTKMMTALLVYDLHDKGDIYLDAPAETYAPELAALDYPTTDSRKVTVRDLVNHTAGFVMDDPWADRQIARTNAELDGFIKNAAPFSAAPGERWEYSNLGYVFLGRIIENITGETFSERLRSRILDPLGMTGSGLATSEINNETRAYGYQNIDGVYLDQPVLASGAFDPLGGMWTTAEDYGRFIGWMLSAWPPRDDTETEGLIPRRVVRMATDGTYLLNAGPRYGSNGNDDCAVAAGYGMGLDQYNHCTIGLALGHIGGFPGYGTYVLMAPEKGFGVFAFANVTYAEVYGPVWDASVMLAEHGYGVARSEPSASSALSDAYRGVVDAYIAGDIKNAGLAVADNFFLDRSASRWNAQLSDIKRRAGACDSESALTASGRLSGSFVWNCKKARVAGQIILSPIKPSPVQLLHIRHMRRDISGNDVVVDFDFH
ncbi:MAG: serine hydrolase domain-containing protein [Pseudomonadota bacterium]